MTKSTSLNIQSIIFSSNHNDAETWQWYIDLTIYVMNYNTVQINTKESEQIQHIIPSIIFYM